MLRRCHIDRTAVGRPLGGPGGDDSARCPRSRFIGCVAGSRSLPIRRALCERPTRTRGSGLDRAVAQTRSPGRRPCCRWGTSSLRDQPTVPKVIRRYPRPCCYERSVNDHDRVVPAVLPPATPNCHRIRHLYQPIPIPFPTALEQMLRRGQGDLIHRVRVVRVDSTSVPMLTGTPSPSDGTRLIPIRYTRTENVIPLNELVTSAGGARH